MKKSTLDDDCTLFHEHMSGVTPLKKNKQMLPDSIKTITATPNIVTNIPDTPPLKRQLITSHAQKNVSVNCHSPCNLHITSESILEWGLDTLAPKQRQKLRAGDFAIEYRIDLHGYDRFAAQDHVNRCIEHASMHSKRHLLVIHGKGSRHGETPILKQHLFIWLSNHPDTLALQSAHAKHGGSGALYVLLKKDRQHHD